MRRAAGTVEIGWADTEEKTVRLIFPFRLSRRQRSLRNQRNNAVEFTIRAVLS